ncbi:MAG TPA: hypothetical protein VFU00_10265 [Gemmatimonadales bacterium]|nr:hypothetical protein [Gemmatimonadales bacterium]
MTARTPGSESSSAIPLPERILGAASGVVILALIVYLAIRALANDGMPPDIHVRMTGVTQVPSGWLVEIEATNRGSAAAVELEIEAELEGPAGTERRSIMFDYVPPRASRRGGLFFTGDPRARPVVLRAAGFRTP